jgi:hypothetical protein
VAQVRADSSDYRANHFPTSEVTLKRFSKFLTIGLTLSALVAAGASAHDRPGKPDKSNRCRPAPVLLAGTLANDPAAGDTSFQLNVRKANHMGRMFRSATQPLSIAVDSNTRYFKSGQASTLDSLAQNDRALVHAKLCRSDLQAARKSGTPPALTARGVLDKGAKPASDETKPETETK